jgi:hypothetical protein
MRTLVAVLIPALLVFAAPASAQQKKKAGSRTAPVWAVNHEVAAPQPAPAPPVTLAPPVAHDAAPCGGKCAGKCGKKEGHKGCCLLDWFCYRRSASCEKGCGCCYYCHPPLYSYFGCDCREGAKHGTVEPKPCPPSSCGSCGWGKLWATGPRMFASPTAHGVCGVR